MTPILDIATTLCLGLMIGVEFAVSAFINPVLLQLDHASRSLATARFGRRLGRAMPFWYIAGLLLLAAESVLRRHTPAAALLWTAVAIWIAVIVITLLVLVPINNRIVAATQPFDPALSGQHARWDFLHRWRVAALTLALLLFLYATRLYA